MKTRIVEPEDTVVARQRLVNNKYTRNNEKTAGREAWPVLYQIFKMW
jgi:hypothetical protein